MNISKCISQLKMMLGLYAITLPFKDEDTNKPIPVENVIHDVLTTMTIPIFSDYVPWMRECEIGITKLKVVDERLGIYMLPAELTLTPIKYVADVRMPYMNNRGSYGDISPAYGISRSVQGVATSQAYMMLAGQMRAEPTFEYLGENKVRLYGWPKTILKFKVACEHEENGETILSSCYSSFMQLAKLDTKMMLYNSLKLYDGIPTAFGEIKLKTEDWQSAEADRDTLLEKWDDTFHVDEVADFEWM